MKRVVKLALAACLLSPQVAPAAEADWTPHTAAALLDATFATPQSCQAALDDARQRESHARPVHGLSYAHLFRQGRCQSFRHQDAPAWRIRMQWTPRTGAALAP